jgi:carbohydrate kinase (thermoresistant glucokinase family)
MILIIMGVAGSGKTTIGAMLAHELGWEFYDGDDFHSESNRAKMSQNIPLTDENRAEWLLSLRSLIEENIRLEHSIVLACSALKSAYRDVLSRNEEIASGRTPSQRHIFFIYLRGTYAQIESRLRGRTGHFMSAEMLTSQFDILEEPRDALIIDITHTPQEIISIIRKGLAL